MCQSHFSYSALSSQHFQPLLIAPLLAKSLEVQAHCLRNGKLAPHPCFSFNFGIRVKWNLELWDLYFDQACVENASGIVVTRQLIQFSGPKRSHIRLKFDICARSQ
jgi:hypothetical protein